jgi:hypothetical protein
MKDTTLLILMIISLMLPSTPIEAVVEDIDTTETKALATKSFDLAEKQVFQGHEPAPDDTTEGCDGSGWIVQGDGHRTRCPHEGCHSNTGDFQEVAPETEVVEPPVAEGTTDVKHKCKCDTSSTYCVCIKKFGQCSCTKK